MMKTTLIAVGGGGLSAAASMAGLFGPPGGFMLAYLAPLPLLLIGLGLGSTAVLIAATTGVAVVAVLGGLTSAGIYGGMHAFPSWLVVRQALMERRGQDPSATEWYPIGSILCSLAVLGAAAATASAVAARGDAGIEVAVQSLLQAAVAMAAPALADADREMFATYLAALFIGMSVLAWLIMLVVNGVLGQRLLARRAWNIRPTPRWSDLILPDWISWLLVVAAAATVFGSGDLEYLARNLVIVFAAPFFFLGLAVVHTLVRPLPMKGLVLAAFYVALALFLAVAGAAVAGLGVIEQWVGVRRRFSAAAPTQRSE